MGNEIRRDFGDRQALDFARSLPPVHEANLAFRNTGTLRFEDVSFGYRADTPVLRELSFHARPGQLIALVGSSGAGKSTVVNLLMRFFDPWTGQVRIDGADIRRLTLLMNALTNCCML